MIPFSKKRNRSLSKEKSRLKKRFSLPCFLKPKKKLLIYVCEGKFDVVKRVGRKLGYKVTTKTSLIPEADLVWTDSSAVNANILSRMKNHNKMNHFPGE